MTARSRHNFLCDIEDSCLIIIDVQEKLTSAIPDKVINRLRKNTGILLNAANELNVPVITTAQYPKGLGTTEAFITQNLAESSLTFEKTRFSCLGADGFTKHLSELGKKQIILTGVEAHICIFQSAIDLGQAGFDVYVVIDAIASREFTSYESALTRLKQANVSLLNTESVLFEWLRDASHEKFKTISKLIH
jgi:nicotinamidase-related amidase